MLVSDKNINGFHRFKKCSACVNVDIKRILKTKLNLWEHLDWHGVAFANEPKNHLLTNLDLLLGVMHKLDKPK